MESSFQVPSEIGSPVGLVQSPLEGVLLKVCLIAIGSSSHKGPGNQQVCMHAGSVSVGSKLRSRSGAHKSHV